MTATENAPRPEYLAAIAKASDFVPFIEFFEKIQLEDGNHVNALVIEYPTEIGDNYAYQAITSFTGLYTKKGWQLDSVAIDHGRRIYDVSKIRNPRIETIKTVRNLRLYTGIVPSEPEPTTEEPESTE